MPRPRLNAARDAGIVAARRSGAKVADLAAQHGLSCPAISKICRAGGVAPREWPTLAISERRRQIAAALRDGIPVSEIASQCRVSKSTVHGVARFLAIRTAGRSTWTPERDRAAARMRAEGMSWDAIGAVLGVHRKTVRERARVIERAGEVG